MKRALFQILVIPFLINESNGPIFLVLKRNVQTGGYWQFVAGGGEGDEKPYEAAFRELSEEIGYEGERQLVKLDFISMIPVKNIGNYDWGEDIVEIPEHCFGIELVSTNIVLSDEHKEYKLLNFDESLSLLKFESNKKALEELNNRLSK